MPTTRNQALSCILGGFVLVALELYLIYLNHSLEEGLPRVDLPALLPDLHREAFGCLVAFLMGWVFFLIPSPLGSSHILRFSALRSLMVGLTAAAATFQLLHLISRYPGWLGASLRPWTTIVIPTLWSAVIPTWVAFFAFAQRAFDARDLGTLGPTHRK